MAFNSLCSREEASFQLRINVMTFLKGDGVVWVSHSSGSDCASTTQRLLPQGRAVWENTFMFTSPERCASVVHVSCFQAVRAAAREGGCMEKATAQLGKITWSI